MATRLTFENTTDEHVRYVAENMRPGDVEEVRLSHGHDPLTALQSSVAATEYPITALSPAGVPLVIFGVVPKSLLSDVGVIWMLGANEVLKFPRNLMVDTAKVFEIWFETYRMLENYVHVLNTISVEWLRRFGFQFDEPIKLPSNGALFMRFYMERDYV